MNISIFSRQNHTPPGSPVELISLLPDSPGLDSSILYDRLTCWLHTHGYLDLPPPPGLLAPEHNRQENIPLLACFVLSISRPRVLVLVVSRPRHVLALNPPSSFLRLRLLILSALYLPWLAGISCDHDLREPQLHHIQPGPQLPGRW